VAYNILTEIYRVGYVGIEDVTAALAGALQSVPQLAQTAQPDG